jgi:hypothetical protein
VLRDESAKLAASVPAGPEDAHGDSMHD